MPEENVEAASPKKKKSPMLMIGIIAGAVLVLTGGSFLAVTKMMAPAGASTESEGEHDDAGHDGGGHGKGGHGKAAGARFEITDLVMNSADQGVPRFVKVSLTFEMKDEKSVNLLTDQDYKVRDLLIRLIGSRTVAELSVPDARENLRLEIMDELNSTAARGGITKIYFTDYIVQ
jgi:flagellar FliL protein